MSMYDRMTDTQNGSKEIDAAIHLAGGLAHDINNLLQPIELACEIVSMKTASEQDPVLMKAVEKIMRGVETTSALVRSILNMARMNVAQNEMQDFMSAVTKSLAVIHDILPAGITLSVDVAEELKATKAKIFYADIYTILSNLVKNASDAMKGRGEIALTLAGIHDFTGLRKDHAPKTYMHIQITDQGEGITDDDLGHIFDPFYTTKPAGQGTGLGLSLVMKAVERLGGYITVDSAQGKGTSFDVYFPVE